ncbi:MAG: hypothetical protein HYS86_04075 [Candidatus Chisholmbacteria bacterium]|nr:hypothetical protein [Candidatus Chisholmbacteria bacterium]
METQRVNWKIVAAVVGLTFGPIMVMAVGRWFMGELSATYREVFQRVQQGVREETIVVGASDETSATYSLLDGWNLISFPFEPSEFDSAAGLVGHVAASGGYITTVSGWEGDQWRTFSQRGAEQFGDDFEIKPYTAYFVRSNVEIEWEVVGKKVAPPMTTLAVGWNGVGFSQATLTARLVIDGLNEDVVESGTSRHPVERVTEIDRWESGFWDPFVKRIYSAEDIQEYGTNFPIETNRGYLIKAEEEVELSL